MALPDSTSVERNDKNIRENEGEISSISLELSGKIRDFCLAIAVATLHVLVERIYIF